MRLFTHVSMVDDDLADEAARLLVGMAGPGGVAAERAGARGQAV